MAWVDSSPDSLLALDRAAREAQLHRAPLHVVVCAAGSFARMRLADRSLNRIQLRDRMIQVTMHTSADDRAEDALGSCAGARLLIASASSTSLRALGALTPPCEVLWVCRDDAQPLDQDRSTRSAAPISPSRNANSKAASRQAS